MCYEQIFTGKAATAPHWQKDEAPTAVPVFPPVPLIDFDRLCCQYTFYDVRGFRLSEDFSSAVSSHHVLLRRCQRHKSSLRALWQAVGAQSNPIQSNPKP